MLQLYGPDGSDHSPKQIIRRLVHLSSRKDNDWHDITAALKTGGLWRCLTCDACMSICPQEIRFREFTEEIRDRALEEGSVEKWAFCRICRKPYLPVDVLEMLKKRLHDQEYSAFIEICPYCRPRHVGNRMIDFLKTQLRAGKSSDPGWPVHH
jgi:Fe-S oxidoreductase